MLNKIGSGVQHTANGWVNRTGAMTKLQIMNITTEVEKFRSLDPSTVSLCFIQKNNVTHKSICNTHSIMVYYVLYNMYGINTSI